MPQKPPIPPKVAPPAGLTLTTQEWAVLRKIASSSARRMVADTRSGERLPDGTRVVRFGRSVRLIFDREAAA